MTNRIICCVTFVLPCFHQHWRGVSSVDKRVYLKTVKDWRKCWIKKYPSGLDRDAKEQGFLLRLTPQFAFPTWPLNPSGMLHVSSFFAFRPNYNMSLNLNETAGLMPLVSTWKETVANQQWVFELRSEDKKTILTMNLHKCWPTDKTELLTYFLALIWYESATSVLV